MPSFQNYRFKGQHPNEEILAVVHRHWFNLLIQFIFVALAISLVIGSFFFLLIYFPNLLQELGYTFVLFLETTLLLFVWFYAFFIWIDYYLDVWIITNERIVNIEQKGLFIREMSELKIANIQDVTTEVTGVIPSVLNFGDVFVQTAGEARRFRFRQVPNPYGIKDQIMSLQHRAHQ
jgi:uncharacterized membrane protein YdbT with pleckstrin-like domain